MSAMPRRSAALALPPLVAAGVIGALLGPPSAGPALAAGDWNFYGSVGMNVGRADNPRFLSETNPNYDPNDPICATTSPPSSVCSPTVSSSARQADYTGTLRLTGGVSGQWPATRFDLVYAPFQSLYYDRSYLNTISHDLISTWHHAWSERSSLQLNENFAYTPEQGADPNTIQQQNTVLVRYSSRTNNSFRGVFALQTSPKTTVTWTFQNLWRAFSSHDFVDSDEQNAGVQWRRRTGRRSFVTSGYQYGLLAFSGTEPGNPNDPNAAPIPRPDAQRHTVNVGYGFDMVGGLNLIVMTGVNTLLSQDPNQRTATGAFVNTSVGYTGGNAAVAAGYNRGFSDGGGIYTTALTQNTFTTARLTFTKTLSADLYAVRNANQRLESTAGSSQTVRSFNGRSTLTYRVGRSLGLNASYTYYRQGTSTPSHTAPDIRSNRYALGMTWSFR